MTDDATQIIEVGLDQWKLEKELKRWKLLAYTLANGIKNNLS